MALKDFPLAHVTDLPDGSTVEWESVGNGPPLIWVEGGPGFWAHMARPDVELFADLFTCYLVNAPGCGRTSAPADVGGYDLPSLLDFFERVRVGLGLGPVTVMGHSWGGLVAAAWAGSFPDSSAGLVVLDGYPGGGASNGVDPAEADAEQERCMGHHTNASWFSEAEAAWDADGEADATHDAPPEEEAWIRSFDPVWPLYFFEPMSAHALPHLTRIRSEVRMNMEMNFAWFGGTNHFDDMTILPLLDRVSCPTLVVAGTHDFICGPTWNRPIAEAIPGSKYVEIAETGHFPQYERPDAVHAAVMDLVGD